MISIITPAYNCEQFIESTFKSVLSQTMTDWEWLIIEDGSSDRTLSIVQQFAANDPRIQVLQNDKNEGAAKSRNHGLLKAKGEFVAFLDADDIWDSRKLRKQTTFMNSEIDFSFTSYNIIDELGASNGKCIDSAGPRFVTYEDMLRKRATIGCSTVMLRRSSIDGMLMPDLRAGQDYAFWLEILKKNNAYLLPIALTKYRIHSGSLSRNKLMKARQQWRIYRQFQRIPPLRAASYFSSYALQALTR